MLWQKLSDRLGLAQNVDRVSAELNSQIAIQSNQIQHIVKTSAIAVAMYAVAGIIASIAIVFALIAAHAALLPYLGPVGSPAVIGIALAVFALIFVLIAKSKLSAPFKYQSFTLPKLYVAPPATDAATVPAQSEPTVYRTRDRESVHRSSNRVGGLDLGGEREAGSWLHQTALNTYREKFRTGQRDVDNLLSSVEGVVEDSVGEALSSASAKMRSADRTTIFAALACATLGGLALSYIDRDRAPRK